jgi:hypothetical protein
MGWRLELVETVADAAGARILVCEIGEIAAPGGIDDVGLGLKPSQNILGALQRAVVGLQEQLLKTKALQLRRADPSLVLKDYRARSVQTLFGTLVIRVPRLVRPGTSLPVPCLIRSSARSGANYDQLRSRLGAFMSFRTAKAIIGDLFPFAEGCSVNTTRRRVLGRAAQIESESDASVPNKGRSSGSIDLGIDTTFVRSAAATGPRHHEVLIGVGTNDQGSCVKIGAVISRTGSPHKLIQKTLRDLGQGDATHMTTFTDGDKMLRGYLKKAGLVAPPLLDWAHLARRVQIAKTTAKGLRCATNAETRAAPLIAKTLDSLHWRLWHGNVDGAREAVKRIARLLRPFDIGSTRARTAIPAKRLQTAMGKLGDYIEGQSAHLVDYGLRYRQGKSIGTASTEGLANTLVNRRMNKLQQMRWSAAGAHAVVVVRAHHINAANFSLPTLANAA